MHEISRLAGRYPWAIVGLAGVAGWVLGAGVLPFGIPGLSSATAPAAAAPVAPAAGAPTSGSPLATSSASMAPGAGPVDDPFAGYGI